MKFWTEEGKEYFFLLVISENNITTILLLKVSKQKQSKQQNKILNYELHIIQWKTCKLQQYIFRNITFILWKTAMETKLETPLVHCFKLFVTRLLQTHKNWSLISARKHRALCRVIYQFVRRQRYRHCSPERRCGEDFPQGTGRPPPVLFTYAHTEHNHTRETVWQCIDTIVFKKVTRKWAKSNTKCTNLQIFLCQTHPWTRSNNHRQRPGGWKQWDELHH